MEFFQRYFSKTRFTDNLYFMQLAPFCQQLSYQNLIIRFSTQKIDNILTHSVR